MSYLDQISDCHSIGEIIDSCHKKIPEPYRMKPWTHPELNHGVDLLEGDDALNCYMSAYGDIHMTRCRAAMMNFPFIQIQGSIEIVDWGCGQGIGSATVVEILQQRDLFQWLRKITLIEPSKAALQRAFLNIRHLTHNAVEIDIKNKHLPTDDTHGKDTLNQIGYRYHNVIHVFSNILDVSNVDLGAVAHLVASSSGRHFILCIGSKNSAAYRIEQFCSVFGEQQYFSKIDSAHYSRTKRTAHTFTCLTRCFSYNGAPINMSNLSQVKENNQEVYDEYDVRLKIQNKVISLEKARISWRLENILAIDDILYVDAVINEVAVDFIIVRPNRGVLLIKVFEENLDNYVLSDDRREIILKYPVSQQTANIKYQSPIELIDFCQTSVKNGIEELLVSTIEDTRNFSLIKKVVVFSGNSINKVKEFFGLDSSEVNFTWLFGEEFILDKNISLSLYQNTQFFYFNRSFDNVIVRKLAKIISPSWHSYQEGRLDMKPIGAQVGLSESRVVQQKISGVAGSGKTQVLAFRAVNAMKRTGGNVLVLTYNITLANYLRFRLSELREDFSWEQIDIYHYHQFFRIRASECGLPIEFTSYDNEKFFDHMRGYKKYSAIFIDEAQDYTTKWLRIIKNFLLEPNGELVVLGDPKQNVYQRPLDVNGDIRLGVIGGIWNNSLKVSRRFANPLLANLAASFQKSFMAEKNLDGITSESTTDNSLNFQILNYIDMRSSCLGRASDSVLVDAIIKIISDSNYEAKDFVVLASSRKLLRGIDVCYRRITNENTEIAFVSEEALNMLERIHNYPCDEANAWKFNRDFEALGRVRKQQFTTDKRCLKLSTIQSFKGWESPAVIVILERDMKLDATEFLMSPEAIYTAITRARESLYVINMGNNTYHNFFEQQLR